MPRVKDNYVFACSCKITRSKIDAMTPVALKRLGIKYKKTVSKSKMICQKHGKPFAYRVSECDCGVEVRSLSQRGPFPHLCKSCKYKSKLKSNREHRHRSKKFDFNRGVYCKEKCSNSGKCYSCKRFDAVIGGYDPLKHFKVA